MKNIPYDTLDVGPVMVKYTFKRAQDMPKVGEVLEDETFTMVVTEANKEELYVKVLLTTNETISSRMDRYQDEIEEATADIAELLYKDTAEGMTALIGWDSLPEDTKEKFISLSKKVVSYLNENNLLVLQYDGIL